MSQLELIATTAFGLEAIVSRELKSLGYTDQTVEDGRVTFAGDESAICRANLWLRCAERVLLKMGSFEALDFGQLFEETRALPWADWLSEDACFPVRGKSVRSQLHSVPDCQSIVKKAIVEKLKQSHKRSWFEETGPTCAVEVSILKDRVTLAIDTTGVGLHKRGYRKLTGTAPLRETLAAALVQLSYWRSGRPFLDPFCGTGTIPIEATLIARNMAPGLNRPFAAEQWRRIPKMTWHDAREQARASTLDDLPQRLIATDYDDKSLSLARYHARRAGVEESIHFQRKDFQELRIRQKYGCLICNPPYGERVGDQDEAERIYRQMQPAFAELETWSIYVLTAHSEFERLFDRRADRRRKLYNGRIPCTYYQFHGPRPSSASIDEKTAQSGE